MSSAASNYNILGMSSGIVLCAAASIIPLTSIIGDSGQSKLAVISVSVLSLSYGCMMFASSYVEEERHYWYWVTSGWITYIFITQLVSASLEISLLIFPRWRQNRSYSQLIMIS